jgi:CotH kinase protein
MDIRGLDRGRNTLLLVCFALCAGLADASATAWAEPVPGEAGLMYERDAVVVIDLTLPQASIEALESEPDEYQPGTFSLAFTDGTPAGVAAPSTPHEVGIRLKGKYGSFRTLAAKAGFKLKLNFVKGKKFLGLKKMTLNNMVQDPSMIHEVLSYEVFRSVGIAAPRTGYAYLRVNGEPYGTYLNVETFDDVALERWFGSFDDPQHLYEGEYGTDLKPGEAPSFEVDEGDEDDRSDLEALIAAVGDESGSFSQRVSGLADLEEMTRMWAVEKYVGHWDGYAGKSGPPFPNNYYLYSDPSGEFQMLPWGTDQTWGERLEFDGDAGVLFGECLADPACWALYREALVEVGAVAAALDLDAMAGETTDLLEPWQQLAPPREEHGLEAIAAAVEVTRGFIAGRPADLANWLNAHPSYGVVVAPKEPFEPPFVAEASISAGPYQPHLGAVSLGRSAMGRGVLTTRVRLPAAGGLRQAATIATAQGTVIACTTQTSAQGARELTLRCYFSDAIRRRLSARWLKIEVETIFTPQAGASESVIRQIVARRVDAAGR